MKIYLSINSNALDDYKPLEKQLKKMKCKMLKWNGGDYTEKDLLSADIVIVVPYYSEDLFTIGVGNYNEMNTSSNADIPTFWYNRVSKKVQQITEVNLYPKTNGDYPDWRNIGYLINTQDVVDLQDEINLIEAER